MVAELNRLRGLTANSNHGDLAAGAERVPGPVYGSLAANDEHVPGAVGDQHGDATQTASGLDQPDRQRRD